jgi:hypothetical protein
MVSRFNKQFKGTVTIPKPLIQFVGAIGTFEICDFIMRARVWESLSNVIAQAMWNRKHITFTMQKFNVDAMPRHLIVVPDRFNFKKPEKLKIGVLGEDDRLSEFKAGINLSIYKTPGMFSFKYIDMSTNYVMSVPRSFDAVAIFPNRAFVRRIRTESIRIQIDPLVELITEVCEDKATKKFGSIEV